MMPEQDHNIRFVAPEDKSFWLSIDKHLSEAEFDKKVRDKQGYVLLIDEKPAGLLRYNLFWDNTPFCTLLFIEGQYQKRGYGCSLMEHWEKDMRAHGYGMVLTSTQVDEDAQHFYRKLGYKDCGGLTVDVPGYEQPMELIMVKQL
jgi:ribosomal protein S18 acetylase RimI-like enzyme